MPTDEFRLSPSQMTTASTWLPLDTLTSDQYEKVMRAIREVAANAFAEGRASQAADAYMRGQLVKPTDHAIGGIERRD